MDPGSSREMSTDEECPKPAGVREETPGEESKGGEGRTVMLRRRGVDEDPAEEVKAQREDDGDDAESQMKTGEEEDAGKHEEELDPRIQACLNIISFT